MTIPLRSDAAAVHPEHSGTGRSHYLAQTRPEHTEMTHSEVDLAVLEAHEIDRVDALHLGGMSWLEQAGGCKGREAVCEACRRVMESWRASETGMNWDVRCCSWSLCQLQLQTRGPTTTEGDGDADVSRATPRHVISGDMIVWRRRFVECGSLLDGYTTCAIAPLWNDRSARQEGSQRCCYPQRLRLTFTSSIQLIRVQHTPYTRRA